MLRKWPPGALRGSRLDRHERAGRGQLGLETFRRILNDPRLAGVTLVQGDCQKTATLEKAGLAKSNVVKPPTTRPATQPAAAQPPAMQPVAAMPAVDAVAPTSQPSTQPITIASPTTQPAASPS